MTRPTSFLHQNRAAFSILAALVFVAVFADFLANERPLYARFEGKTYWPALRGVAVDLNVATFQEPFLTENWREIQFKNAVWPPVPYSAATLDLKNANCRSPFGNQEIRSLRWRHWLGTDANGRDVLAGLIRGSRIALLVGIVAMGIAATLGILLGSLAGFFGDDRLKISRIQLIFNGLAAFAALFWGFIARSFYLTDFVEILKSVGLAALFFSFANFAVRPLERLGWPIFSRKITLPADLFIMRFAEIFNAVPRLILLIAVAAALETPSIWLLITVIGAISWTGVARFVRAEMLRIRTLGYIQAARMLGLSDLKIIWRHALPNALPPTLVALTFGIGGAILTESFLSFLGIGVPPNVVTWGSMLNEGRNHFEAPWLLFFPGLMLFLTVLAFNLLGEALEKWLDPRRKSRPA